MTFLLLTPKLSLSQRRKNDEILPYLVSGNQLSTQREKQICLRLFQLNRSMLDSSQHFYSLLKQQWCHSSAALGHCHGLPWSGCHTSIPHSVQLSHNLMSVYPSIWSQQCDEKHRTDGETRRCCIIFCQGGCLQQV